MPGTIIRSTLTKGLKRPKNAKHNQALGPNPPGHCRHLYLGAKTLSGCNSPNARSAHGPMPRDSLARGLTGRRTIPASLEVPSAEPSAGPRREGNSASFETPLGRLELRLNHSTGRAHLLHPLRGMGLESDGVGRRQPPRRAADVTGVPSACTDHCAAIPGAVWISGTLCGHV